MSALTVLEDELLSVVREIGPEVAQSLINLVKGALNGEPEHEIKKKAEHTATLAIFKASYRRGSKP